MALYRCAACGSPNVVTDTQQQGYDYVKGAIGTVVLGVGGAAAGINGKTKKVYKCPDCGLTLNEPMSFEIHTLIDVGVAYPSARKNLKLGDVPVEWDYFTRKYKNIEKDTERTVIADNTVAAQPVQQQEEPIVITEETKRNSIVYKVAFVKYMEACKQWQNEYFSVMEKRDEERDKKWSEEKAQLEAQITTKRDTIIKEHTAKREQYAKEQREAETFLSTLGFFQFGEKKSTKQRIEQLTSSVCREEVLIRQAQDDYSTEMQVVKEQLGARNKERQVEIAAKYPLPLKPKKPSGMIDYTEDGQTVDGRKVVLAYYKETIFRFIEEKRYANFAQIKTHPGLVGMSDSHIRGMLNEMVEDEELETLANDYCIKRIIPYKVLPDITADDLAVYAEYEKEKAEKAAKKEQERKEKYQQILDGMEAVKGKGPMTIAEILENSPALSSYTTYQIGPILHAMAAEGIIIKTEKSRRSYFEYK